VFEPGRFGPSRKKEAAARRFGNYELWVLNAAMIRAMLVDGRMREKFCPWLPGVIRVAMVSRGKKRHSKALASGGSGG